MYFGDMDVEIHVVGEVNYLSNICKPVFLLQSCVQLANLGGVKLFEPRRKKIEFVHVGGAYHFIRQGNMFLRVVGIAANGKSCGLSAVMPTFRIASCNCSFVAGISNQ